jgi:arachidonate 15-lipoxygenase
MDVKGLTMPALRRQLALARGAVRRFGDRLPTPHPAGPLSRRFDRAVLSLLTFGVVTLVVLKSLLTRQRMSHDNGITARGRLRIVDSPRFPTIDLFTPGREFDCRVRHGGASFHDDAMMVVRSCSIKFADHPIDSPFDVLMNTSDSVAFNDAWSFAQFMYITIRGRGEKVSRWMYDRYPRLWVGLQGLNRRDPASYAQMRYQSKTPLEYRAKDGRLRYVKFRMIPAVDGPESGLCNAADKETPWNQAPIPEERLGPNYLKDELRSRVATEGVHYRMQLQLHEWKAGDTRAVFDAARPWDESTHPWLDLATVELTEILPWEANVATQCMLSNRPDSLAVIEPLSIHDPPSLDHLRLAGVWARRARRLANSLFGIPAPIPDARPKAKVPPPPRGSDQVPTLPQHDDPARQREREREIEAAQFVYEWRHAPGQPPFVAELPPAEAFAGRKKHRMMHDLEGTLADLGLAVVAKRFERHGCLDEFDAYYLLRKKPAVAWRFHRDDEFGRQRVAGVNPVLIERCDRIPDHFPVTEETVRGLLREGDSLEAARSEGRLYLLDYAILEGLPVHPGRYLTHPLCLLYVNGDGRLVPIAIQLGQTPDAGPIFTPNDSPWLWLTVKTYVQSADASYHEVASHLMRTHMIMEAVAVSTYRTLDSRHPIHALLAPHFAGTMAINHGARTSMLAPGGAIDRTMAPGADGSLDLGARVWKDWSFDRYDLRTDLRIRGVDDTERLPDYPYRDDALRIWDTIESFVSDVLGRYYPDEDEIRKDWELQAWARELCDERGGQLRGLPGEGAINTRKRLVQTVTQIVFTGSAEHASVNNGQWDMFGYIPNVPGALYAPPPTTKDELSQQHFVEILPHRRAAAEQLGMVHLLSMPTEDPLGHYALTRFFGGDPVISRRTLAFMDELDELSDAIQLRNLSLPVPYTYLDPRLIAQSTAI